MLVTRRIYTKTIKLRHGEAGFLHFRSTQLWRLNDSTEMREEPFRFAFTIRSTNRQRVGKICVREVSKLHKRFHHDLTKQR